MGLEYVNGSWMWESTKEALIYSNWDKDADVEGNRTFAYVNTKASGLWKTANADQLGLPICEYSALLKPKPPSVSDFVSSQVCNVIDGDNVCFRFVQLQMNHDASREFCAKYDLRWPSKPFDLRQISAQIFQSLLVNVNYFKHPDQEVRYNRW